jgi:hypothetical protein
LNGHKISGKKEFVCEVEAILVAYTVKCMEEEKQEDEEWKRNRGRRRRRMRTEIREKKKKNSFFHLHCY